MGTQETVFKCPRWVFLKNFDVTGLSLINRIAFSILVMVIVFNPVQTRLLLLLLLLFVLFSWVTIKAIRIRIHSTSKDVSFFKVRNGR